MQGATGNKESNSKQKLLKFVKCVQYFFFHLTMSLAEWSESCLTLMGIVQYKLKPKSPFSSPTIIEFLLHFLLFWWLQSIHSLDKKR